ncbi:hypothetical protein P7F88_21240 [Vibrio hannami]|uniref:hypothetical protein n=1 Tax=Vibrio hannami TaxID=2717094 RepID=UPI00240F1BD6|nr:hypothetical protein [Vibrio hannami]MDG3088448.1 hypothetical protein [Vibrio hannami]
MDFVEKMRLRGKAEEDRFFAELDRQLIEAMHEKQKMEEESKRFKPEGDDFGNQSK